ncbi:MAG: carboxypeptidase-like regulatory domain-containing protein [Cryomorphaceae bacterium]|nr:carboxypeptidase-like regulatory domain-containing protein [Cryomorphaceae bacterium]
MLRQTTTFLLLFSYFFAYAQPSTFTGSVKDINGEALIGVNIVLKGDRVYGTSTDISGRFSLENIIAGSYELEVSYVGYKTQRKTITFSKGANQKLDIKLEESATSLNAAVVSAERVMNTEKALVLATKDAKEVVSGISMQEISRSQDGNAAQVMQRVPGVTIVGNRFVMIRGISERYNNVMINNVVAPSTEVDKRTFSFDLLSAGSLDRMMIYKSGSPDLPGDFAGGVIKITTKNEVTEDFINLHFDVGYRQNTTFGTYMQSQGSPTDFLGFDNGFRSLPSNFPSTYDYQGLNNASPQKAEIARELNNNFAPQAMNALPDHSVGVSIGRVGKLNGKKLTSFNSFNIGTSYQQYQRSFNRYFEWVDQTNPILPWEAYLDDHYTKSQKVNILSNWTYDLGHGNILKFSNFFTQIGENETIIRNGNNFLQRPDSDFRNYLLGFQSRSIYTGQLEGIHLRDKSKIDWVVGFSYLGESEPDLRRFRTFRDISAGDEEPFMMQLPPSSNIFETGRYWGELHETSNSFGFNYTKEIGAQGNQKREIKVGTYTDYRSRSFNSRYFSYLYPGFFEPNEGERLIRLPLNEIFAPENIRSKDGFALEEGTRPLDSYSASNLLNAAYVKLVYPWKRFNFSGGVRGEFNIQNMLSEDNAGVIEVNNPIFSTLPFANVTYMVSPKNQLRASASTTVNRPEFRELAPFLFYDYKMNAGRYGNPDLKTAVIQNFDMRWEYYPRLGEVISLGTFYKYFTNPIENRSIITTEQPSLSYMNADFAQNYGLESEIRLSMKDRIANRFLQRFSINLNASYIISEVDLGDGAVAQSRVRPLEGQSPYIVNTGMYYEDAKRKVNMAVQYNIFGARIFLVGDDNFPTIYELPRHSLDFSFSKQIGKSIDMKFGVQNILNYAYRFYQDSDRNETIDDRDHEVFGYRVGSVTTLSFTIRLN